MRPRIRKILLPVMASTLSIGVTLLNAQANGKTNEHGTSSQATPPYHKSARDAEPLPRVLPASQFSDRPLVARAYQIAGEIPLVLAQQPCYCACSREFGHTSLLDCFASTHTAGCGICMAETFYSYQMTKQGKTPAEVRQGIIRGDWRNARPIEK